MRRGTQELPQWGACVTDPPCTRHIRVNAAMHTRGPVRTSRHFHGESIHGERVDEVLTVHTEPERGAPFCGNPDCALHIRLSDEQVDGWLTLADGRMFGRSRSGNTVLCDACATRRGPVRIGTLTS
jgi:hypothetical protein